MTTRILYYFFEIQISFTIGLSIFLLKFSHKDYWNGLNWWEKCNWISWFSDTMNDAKVSNISVEMRRKIRKNIFNRFNSREFLFCWGSKNIGTLFWIQHFCQSLKILYFQKLLHDSFERKIQNLHANTQYALFKHIIIWKEPTFALLIEHLHHSY